MKIYIERTNLFCVECTPEQEEWIRTCMRDNPNFNIYNATYEALYEGIVDEEDFIDEDYKVEITSVEEQ